jgi:ubiquinol-cytochrome c reductase cytochrome c1 subunit
MRVLSFPKLLTVAALAGTLAGGAAMAAEAPEPISRDWPHQGVFGSFDRAALQRGMQVYKGVCAGCHGLKYVAFRNLEALGYNADEISAIAADYYVEDGPDDFGDMFEREAVASDHWPSPFANEQAARAANGGAYPPDLSVITKARAGGEDYIYSLLVGYEEPPEGFELMPGMNYNEYFAGHQIAMAQPLWPDMVEYQDGTEATVSQMAADVTQFLHWAAEPKLEQRKQTGIKVILFLIVMSIIFYAYKRRIWRDVHH